MVIGPFLGEVWVQVFLCTYHLLYWNTVLPPPAHLPITQSLE
jgi:hypothetical protein